MSMVDLSYHVAQRLVLILTHEPPEPGSVWLISLCLMLRGCCRGPRVCPLLVSPAILLESEQY